MDIFYHLIDEQKKLLLSRGYDETALHSPDRQGWLFRQLEINFSISFTDAQKFDEKTGFELSAIGFFNDERDIVVFRFAYEYDPWKESLAIKKISADHDQEHVEYLLTKNEDLPHATDIHKQLTLNNRVALARQIASHTVRGKRKKM